MKRLIAFGDSWTAGHGIELDIQYKEVISPNPFIDKLRTSNGWPRHLATHYDIPFVNFGWCNKSNPEIIQDIKDNLQHLDKHDLIVVMLSFPYRGIGEPLHDISSIERLLEGYDYYIFNSFYPSLLDIDEKTIEEAKQILGLSLDRFVNRGDTFVPYLQQWEKDNDTSPWEYNFRQPESWQNTLYGDTHPNWNGYKIIADKIKQYIDDYNTNSSTK